MFSAFASDKNKMKEELNALINPLTAYKWEYKKEEGYYLSFPIVSMAGDFLHDSIQKAFADLETKIVGNSLNAKEGTRLIITSKKELKLEHIQKASLHLQKAYPNEFKRQGLGKS